MRFPCWRSTIVLCAFGASILASTLRAGETYHPIAEPAACTVVDHARFTVLTPALIRLEWAPDGKFEDRASYAFLNRRLPAPEIHKSTEDGWFTLKTRDLKLRYKLQSDGFTPDTLSIELMLDGQPVTWKPGMPEGRNLRGTTRTLDGVSGSCPLEPGLVSRDGWSLVDDSQRPLFDNSDWPWAVARPAPEANKDWYFFGYGHDYQRALRDFTLVAGRIPLPPRYAFGAWWSRYWAYSDAELRELVNDFREHDVPLDVLVIDMDWHLDGWTGYTWNPKYFPDPAGFLKWVKQQGLRATLNLHPADGVGKHEAAFADFAPALGVDPESTDRIPFDPTNRKYVDAYFKYLHHPLERMGIEFWWMDYQQSRVTAIPGLDPLPWLNYLHWTDMERNPDRAPLRPMLFSRWGGLGNHRYQIGFSGDTYCDWPSLAFQPYFTSTAANVGFTYWSHDIGGHQPGKVDPELYTRWVQWGALSPALRTHTTKNAAAERRIWKFPDEYFHAMRDAFRLRYELIPYLYTAARRCYDLATPMLRPLYYAWPEMDDAYANGGQYLLGDQMMIAPVATPRSDWSGCAEVRVWIPPGEWTYWYSGRRYQGPNYATLFVPLDEIPIFTLAGAIIPMQTPRQRVDEKPVDPLILHVVNGFGGATSLYEDDGVTDDYQKNRFAWTPFQHLIDQNTRQIIIGASHGEFEGKLQQRRYEVQFHDALPPTDVKVDDKSLSPLAAPGENGWWYDADALSIVVRTPMLAMNSEHRVSVQMSAGWDTDEPLAAGLRGKLHLADVLIREMGASAPAALQKIAALRKEIAANPTTAATRLQSLAGDWNAAVAAVNSTDSWPADKRAAAVVRMLGVPINIRFVDGASHDGGQNGPQTSVTAIVDVGRPADMPAEDLKSTINATAEGRWRVDGVSDNRIQLTTAGTPQTGQLHVGVELSVGDVKVNLPIARTFFPSVNTWWVVGPFDAEFEKALDTPYPPEQGVDLKASYTGKDGASIGWKKIERPLNGSLSAGDEFFVHLHTVFGKRIDNAVAYAMTTIESPGDAEARLALGSDDGVVVWLNGVEVHRNNIGRAYSPKQDIVPISLKKGKNTLLLKINQGGGDWGFGAHVETRDGNPLPQVTVGVDP